MRERLFAGVALLAGVAVELSLRPPSRAGSCAAEGKVFIIVIIWAVFFGFFGFSSGLGWFYFLDFFFLQRDRGLGWIVQIGLLVIIFVFVTIFGSGFADWGRRRGRHGRKCRPGPTF